jgi:hypothetical protein
MHVDLKLHLTKQTINLLTKLMVKLIPKTKNVCTPQTKMLLKLKKRLIRAYYLEVATGVFKEKNRVSDGNFERVLQLFDLLAYLSENDRYYRMYVGYLFLECKRIYNETKFTPQQVKHELKEQWETDIDFLNDRHIVVFMDDFKEAVLTDHLANY